jgi:hypothetical protein
MTPAVYQLTTYIENKKDQIYYLCQLQLWSWFVFFRPETNISKILNFPLNFRLKVNKPDLKSNVFYMTIVKSTDIYENPFIIWNFV